MKKIERVILLLSILAMINSYAQKLSYTIHANGSYDIIGSNVKLKNCYPAINNTPIRPVNVKVTTSSIEYVLENGKIELIFALEANYLTLNTQTTLQKGIAVNISPIYNGIAESANRFYKTSGGIMGDGGIKNFPEKNQETSTLLTALLPDTGQTMIIATHDVNKYVSFVELKQLEGKNSVNISLQTEKVAPTNLPTIYFSQDIKPYDGMRKEAQAIAQTMKARTDKPQAYLWCSWYYTFNYLTENMLSEYLTRFEQVKPRIPLQTVQIDAGYHPHVGDWLEPSEKFPNGISKSVKEITNKGYKAGIWIAPYMVGNRSKVFKEHPNWVMKWGDGTPVRFYQFFDEQRLFGALDEEYFTLDTSNPEVMEYLRQVFRAFKKMGITYFKTDFMMWGDQQSNNLQRVTLGKTSVEYQREFNDMIREEIGEESFWLGCIATFPSFIGYVDGMRISADITAKWDGAESMFKESIGNQHINNVWWQNDPDAMILRSKFNKMTDTESYTINLWMGLLGGMVNTSDLFHELPKDRVELYRALEPSKNKTTANFPFIDKNQDLDVLVKELKTENTWLVLVVNRKEIKQKATYPLLSLVNKQKLFVTQWHLGQTIEMGEIQNLNIELNPHESKLYYVSKANDAAHKFTLGGKEIKK